MQVPKELRNTAVLMEPTSIAVKGMEQAAEFRNRSDNLVNITVVLGAGPLGLLSTALFRLRGYNTYTLDIAPRSSLKAQLAVRIGAIYLDANESPVESLPDKIGNLDLILEATGNSTVAFQAIGALRTNGVLCLMGVPTGEEPLNICVDCLNMQMVLGNKMVFGTVNSNRGHFERAIEALAHIEERWPGWLSSLITRQLMSEEFTEGLRFTLHDIKTVIELVQLTQQRFTIYGQIRRYSLMRNYDAIIIGSGCGALIADVAASKGYRTALIDKGPLIGGTCLNWGCIPSKMLIYVADRIAEIEEGKKLGIDAEIRDVAFHAIMERMRNSRQKSQAHIRQGIKQQKNLDFYEGECQFVSDYALEVNGHKLKGGNIFIASGSRPFTPPIKGLDNVDYLTNESVLELRDRPDSLIIIGGGYIAVEYGHFFAAMGTKVTIVEMADRLVLSEESEISEVLKKELSKRIAVHTDARAEEVKASRRGVCVVTADRKSGKEREFVAQKIMMAVGRRSNADLLKVENTGVAADNRGFIKVNEYMETSKKHIYAVGDANGQQMFTHMANREAAIVAQNVFYGTKLKVDYTAVPHAVYSHPQIASVGLKEEDAKKNHEIIVGRTEYFDIAKGEAMLEKEGYAKAIVEKGTNRILGFHIIGPCAPELIQEVVNAMTSGRHIEEIDQGIHIHPALSELVLTTLSSLQES